MESYVQENVPARSVDRGFSYAGFAFSILTLLFVGLLAFLAVSQDTPPRAVDANAPLTDFSSGRAMRYVQAVGERPHPLGTAEHERVRQYILDELAALGLNPEVQTADVVSQRPFVPRINGGTVHNVVARLKGTGGGRALLLMGHYDSVPTSRGASDDGSAVAVMLETLRALKAGAPLKNDVICLFTDGEEVGLLGAKAFVDEHPWAKDVGLALNFEARGTDGPAVMFETSADNGWLVRQFAQAAPRPVSSSLFYEIYRVLPNDTDLAVFKEAGYSGLNFAYLDGYPHYHTLSDSPENIDPRSLQHQGSYALTLARRFGDLDLGATKERNVVYFNTLGSGLVLYSEAWVVPLTVLAVLLFAAVLVSGFRRRLLTASGIVKGFFSLLLTMVCAAVLVTVVLMFVRAVHSGYRAILQGSTYNNGLYVASFLALTVAAAAALYLWFRKRAEGPNLLVGGMCWWVVFTVLTGLCLPGASYLFAWPLLFTSAATALAFASRGEEAFSGWRLGLYYVCVVPAVVLCAPVVYLLSVGLPLAMFRAAIVLVVMLLALLLPLLKVVAAPSGWLLPGAATLCAAGFLVAGSMTAGFSRNNPLPTNLFYALNADTGRAVWASSERKPDEWTGQFLPQDAERGPLAEYIPSRFSDFLSAQAPAIPIAAPNVTLLDKSADNGVRTVRMRITSQRQAPVISVVVESDAEIVGAEVNHKPVASHGGTLRVPFFMAPPAGMKKRWELSYYAPPGEGIELSLATKSSQPLSVRVMDQSYGLPDAPAQSSQARPDNMMPMPYPFVPYSDSTLVSRSFSF